MWGAQQTLLHKSTGKLWTFGPPVSEAGTVWAWLANEEICMIGEDGQMKGFKDMGEFTHVADEFGEPVHGTSKLDRSGDRPKIIGPDVSIHKYINMTEKSKAKRRKVIIKKLVEDHVKKFTDLAGAYRAGKQDRLHENFFAGSSYRKRPFVEAFPAACQQWFNGGSMGQYFLLADELFHFRNDVMFQGTLITPTVGEQADMMLLINFMGCRK